MIAALRHFAVRGVIWRNYLDWAVLHLPFYVQPVLLFYWTIFFFFFAAPARRAIVNNLSVILPGSTFPGNQLRAFRTLLNFAWTITEAANFRLRRTDYAYELVGNELLEALARSPAAIVLTAHMGSYDLGAALFAERFGRNIRMVRAREPDRNTAEHFERTIQQGSTGAVKVSYNQQGAMLSFDLLQALRSGDIISIQGDRVIPGVAAASGEMFGHPVRVPAGPFTLALVAQVPIYPLFIVRTGFRRYRVIVREPIELRRTGRGRDTEIAEGVATWCSTLQEVIRSHWDQWFALAPIFVTHERA